MVFEVIDPINDPHIIKYDRQQLVLLDIIKNDFNTEKIEYSELVKLAEHFKLKVKELELKIDDFDMLQDFLNNYVEKIDFEGFVIEDSSGYMFKVKSPFYLFWKSCRKIKDDILKGKNIDYRKLTKEQAEVAKFMEKNPVNLIGRSIIQVRKEFERYQNERQSGF